MLQKPPHILVTTPESLFILLTAEKSRVMLSSARTVIVDEIHAVRRRQTRLTSRVVTRSAGTADPPKGEQQRTREQASTDRPVGDSQADRGSRELF